MARIRSVHPGLWTDEAFVSASPMARLFCIGLWGGASKRGRRVRVAPATA